MIRSVIQPYTAQLISSFDEDHVDELIEYMEDIISYIKNDNEESIN